MLQRKESTKDALDDNMSVIQIYFSLLHEFIQQMS